MAQALVLFVPTRGRFASSVVVSVMAVGCLAYSSIDSQQNRGTRIRASVPLASASNHDLAVTDLKWN